MYQLPEVVLPRFLSYLLFPVACKWLIDQIVVRNPERKNTVINASSGPSSPIHKKMKTQGALLRKKSDSSIEFNEKVSSKTQGKTRAPIQESPEEEMSDEAVDNTLLIDSMARE